MLNSKGQRILSFEERQKVINEGKNKNKQNNTTNLQENATNPLSKYLTLTEEDRFQNQQDKINAKYDSQINNLNLGKTTQQQQADITRSQLQKYLPYYYKSKGLSGLGLEQSAMLDANANYTNQLGQIENNFTQQKNALENYRQDDLMKAENDYLDRIDENSKSAYDEVTFALQNYINDEKLAADEISKTQTLLDLYRDQMNQTDIKMAENLLENYKTQFGEEETKNDVASTLKDDFELTDAMRKGNEPIPIGDKKYLTYEINPIFGAHHMKGWFNDRAKEKGYVNSDDPRIPNGTLITDEKNNGYFMFYNGEWLPVKEFKQ